MWPTRPLVSTTTLLRGFNQFIVGAVLHVWAPCSPLLETYSIMLTRMFTPSITAIVILIITSSPLLAQDIGSVDTKFNLLSPDDSINVAAFADPAVDGVTCYLSRAQKGGYKGALGLAEDPSDASLDCRQTGVITFKDSFKKGDAVFRERRSLVFKALKVVRFCDTQNNALVYLAYSEKVIDGSPKNSVSAVPLRAWSSEDSTGSVAPICNYKE